MNTESHIKSTGGAGKEVHEFLDQFFALYRIDHRVILHHKIGMRLVGLKFGTDAIPIAEKHIRDDWNGEIPEGPDDLSFYREAWACDAQMFRDAYKKAKQLEREMLKKR